MNLNIARISVLTVKQNGLHYSSGFFQIKRFAFQDLCGNLTKIEVACTPVDHNEADLETTKYGKKWMPAMTVIVADIQMEMWNLSTRSNVIIPFPAYAYIIFTARYFLFVLMTASNGPYSNPSQLWVEHFCLVSWRTSLAPLYELGISLPQNTNYPELPFPDYGWTCLDRPTFYIARLTMNAIGLTRSLFNATKFRFVSWSYGLILDRFLDRVSGQGA